MTTIPGITNTSTTTASKTTSKASALGQEQFLTLLVAQLQNQDPLNPTDATEFTAQLAQYSQLEQLFNLNDSMDQLATAQNNSERLSALSLIGQDVVVEESEFTLGAEPVQIGYKIDGTVTDANLLIKNSSGKTVATLAAKDLSAGNHYLTWDGKDSSGNTLAPGKYSITIDAEKRRRNKRHRRSLGALRSHRHRFERHRSKNSHRIGRIQNIFHPRRLQQQTRAQPPATPDKRGSGFSAAATTAQPLFPYHRRRIGNRAVVRGKTSLSNGRRGDN